jgi:electron transfer flavoprotein alpha subunit
VSKGYELAQRIGEPLVAIIVGDSALGSFPAKSALAGYGIDEVRLVSCGQLHTYQVEDVAQALCEEVKKGKPRFLLFLGSQFGRSLAPRVAARLGTGLTADCTDLYVQDDKKLVQVRPTYGGRVLASIICPFTYPQMASVRPNTFEICKRSDKGEPPAILERQISIRSIEQFKCILSTRASEASGASLEDAEVVVCGGLGMGGKEGFTLLRSLSERVGGVVAGTREAVDRGWVSVAEQVGQTGKTVRPRVYVGCGVSGAIHHLIGMRRSRNIIAINKDPRAPIFKIATVGIIGDVYEVLPALIERL